MITSIYANRLRPHIYRNLVPISELQQLAIVQVSGDGYDYEFHPKTEEFVDDVCKALRCKWGVTSNREWGRVYLYHPDDTYAMGYVKVSQGDNKTLYTVQSRTINNERYGDHNNLYNTKQTTLSTTALKNAKRHLTPITPIELFIISHETQQSASSAVHHAVSANIDERFDKLGLDATARRLVVQNQKSIAYEEMKALNARGHEFVDPNTAVILDFIADELEIYKEFTAGRTNSVFYCVKGDTVHTIEGQDYYNMYPDTKVGVQKWDELSEAVQGKLASLSILEEGAYVVGVGHKGVGGNVFYVSP